MEVLNDCWIQKKNMILPLPFYSVFRLPQATLKGAGTIAINNLIELCLDLGIKNYFTLSPIPLMENFL